MDTHIDMQDLQHDTTEMMEHHEITTGPSEIEFPDKIYSFLRPFHNEPRHIVLSSAFARRLAVAAAGPIKPPWYCAPLAKQFLVFKQLCQLVEDGRSRPMEFHPFASLLAQLAPTVTPEEVIYVLKKMDRTDWIELDFGEFLFVLSNNPIYDLILLAPHYQEYVKKHHFNPRQRVFFSALAFFCLVQTEDDIARVYRADKTSHFDVLKYHMASARNEGLSELQMEERQMEVRKLVERFKKKFHTVYTVPVPFVKATVHEPIFESYLKRKKSLSKTLYPEDGKKKKKPAHRRIVPIEPKRPLGGPAVYETEEDYLLHLYLMASIPRPEMKVPAHKLKRMRKSIHESDKLYLQQLRETALADYCNRLKEATIVYSKATLKEQFQKGFTDDVSKLMYFNLFRNYMQLKKSDTFIFHPWTPMNIGAKYKKKPKTPPPFGKSGR